MMEKGRMLEVHCINSPSKISLFKDIVKEGKFLEKFQMCLDIQKDISSITDKYHKSAVGPAASEVLERGLSELHQFSDILQNIPGPPMCSL